MASYSDVSVTYIVDGIQTIFSFPFDYLRKAFVKVESDENVLIQGTDFSVYEKTVVFTEAPVVGTTLRIYRETETIPLVSWADASVLRAKDMTIQQVQVLHILEEYKGQYNEDLANMLIIAGVVTDSGELQHIVNQLNTIDTNTQKAVNAANIATIKEAAAASSASSAEETARALTNFLETKETLTAPAVDTTLSISNAAADAKVTGDTIKRIDGSVSDSFFEKYVMGNPVYITDGAENIPAESLSVHLDYNANGYSSVTVNDAIDNLIDVTTFGLQQVNSGGTMRDGYKPVVLKAGTYTISYTSIQESPAATAYFVDITHNYATITITSNPQTITVSNDNTEVLIRFSTAGAPSTNFVGVKLQKGSIVTPYIEPRIVTADLTDLEGTIYGGTIDFISGIVTSKYASDGTELNPAVVYSIPKRNILTAKGINNIIVSDGIAFINYRVSMNIYDNIKDYDVVIVGSGAAGIGACYALKDSGLRIALIEKDDRIGGNHINAWVNGAATSLPPKYMSDLFNEMIGEGSAYYTNGYTTPVENDDETKSWVWGKYRTDGVDVDYGINYNQEILCTKYIRDLESKVDIYTNAKITGCIRDTDSVQSIIVNNEMLFNAKFFIDSR